MSEPNEPVDTSLEEQDRSQSSLDEDVKQLLEDHFTKKGVRTPKATALSDGALPNRSALTSSVISTQFSAAYSSPLLPLSASSSGTMPRRYVDIKEKIDENKKLKAENFELKKRVFLLTRELPAMKDGDGNDFTEDYLECRDQLYNEQTRRLELEGELISCKEESNELKRKLNDQKEEWTSVRKRLIDERDRLSEECALQRREMNSKLHQVRQLTSQVDGLTRQMSAEEGTDSQADVSLSSISVMSSRDRMIEDLKGTIIAMTIKENERAQMQQRLDALSGDLTRLNKQLDTQTTSLREERELRIETQSDLKKLQNELSEAQRSQQALQKEMAKKADNSETELTKLRRCVEQRNRAINALMKKVSYEQVSAASFDQMPSGFGRKPAEAMATTALQDITDSNPIVRKLLGRVSQISSTNSEMVEEIERLKKAGAFDQQIDLSETCESSVDESSVWDQQRLKTENKNAKAGMMFEPDTEMSLQEMLQAKVREFERTRKGAPPPLRPANLERDLSLRSSLVPSEMPELSTMGDLYNQSLTALDDLDTLKKSVSLLRKISVRLFDKLRGSATFLQSLLEELGQSDKGHAFMREIEEMRIEFGRSATTAAEIMNGVEVAERSITEFRAQVERSMNYSMTSVSTTRIDFNKSNNQANVSLGTNKMTGRVMNEAIAKLEMELSVIQKKLVERDGECAELQQQLAAVTQQKSGLERKVSELESCRVDKTRIESVLSEQNELLQKQLEEIKAEGSRKENEILQIANEAQKQCGNFEKATAVLQKNLDIAEQSLSKKNAEVKSISRALHEREKEFNHFKQEYTQLEVKSRELIAAVKDSMSSVMAIPSKLTRDIATSSREMPHTSCADQGQIATQIEHMDVHITDLKGELGMVREVLEECAAGRKIAEERCSSLDAQLCKQKEDVMKYKELADAAGDRRKKSKCASTQSDIKLQNVNALEDELKKVQIKNATIEENFQRMCRKVMELEANTAKSDTDKDKLEVGDSASKNASDNLRKVNTPSMTSLSSDDVQGMEGQLESYRGFASNLHNFLARWNRKETTATKSWFSAGDLQKMYEKMIRIQKLSDDEIVTLRTQLETTQSRMSAYASGTRRKRSSSSSQRSSSGSMKMAVSEGAMVSNSSSPMSLESEQLEMVRAELSVEDVNEMYHSSHSVVKLIKDLLTSNSSTFGEEEVSVALQKARTMRSQLAALCTRLSQFDKAKENMDPSGTVDALKTENVKLQLALNDAEAMLKNSHEKLRTQPNSEAMCEAIVREIGKISKAMKTTTRDVNRYRHMRHVAVSRHRTESS